MIFAVQLSGLAATQLTKGITEQAAPWSVDISQVRTARCARRSGAVDDHGQDRNALTCCSR